MSVFVQPNICINLKKCLIDKSARYLLKEKAAVSGGKWHHCRVFILYNSTIRFFPFSGAPHHGYLSATISLPLIWEACHEIRYTGAAQWDESSAESSFRLSRVGGNILGMLN
jgi:hypothetical protein